MRRFREEGEAGLEDRSSRPHHSPDRVPLEVEEQIVSDRITEKEGPHLMAGRLGVPRSTIYGVLARRGLSRLSDLDRTTGTPIRYVKDCQVNWYMWTLRNWAKYLMEAVACERTKQSWSPSKGRL